MKPNEFVFIADFLRNRSGVVLEAGKAYLVEARLIPLVKEVGYPSLSTLFDLLRGDGNEELKDRVVEEMTTNETSFFRDTHPFDMLESHVIPELIENRSAEKEIRIWSAGCSAGQEPYSIAILLRESFPELADWNVSILATDLSRSILERARVGSYSQLEINRGLAAPLRDKYFTRSGLRWQVRDELRDMVDFRQLNLLQPITHIPPVHIVFIRNVLIYFDLDLQRDTLERVRAIIDSSSTVFLGRSETTLNVDDHFERIDHLPRTGCYRLKKG